jgi:hypothetical protein
MAQMPNLNTFYFPDYCSVNGKIGKLNDLIMANKSDKSHWSALCPYLVVSLELKLHNDNECVSLRNTITWNVNFTLFPL